MDSGKNRTEQVKPEQPLRYPSTIAIQAGVILISQAEASTLLHLKLLPRHVRETLYYQQTSASSLTDSKGLKQPWEARD